MKEDFQQEVKLAKEMKEQCCDKQGKETKPAEAAEFIHKIGLIYRQKSPVKIALIKSAGLFNAAIVRNPSNVSQIKSDLYELCHHILQLANATKPNVDLIKKAENVKVLITKLRQEVAKCLENSVMKIPETAPESHVNLRKKQKIFATKTLNKMIAKKYKQNMSAISQFCEEILGKPPCEYAVVGMGSLAREEITPYSDFEHIILLCNQNNYESSLEYFRWFSVIFHIIILNVQETIIPSLHICSLNDKEFCLGDWFYDAITPRGISFDGMMPHAAKYPLGRQEHTKIKPFTTELIKPVNEMLQYLSTEADLKHGYHLADILTKTCFVYGNENIHKQFLVGIQKYQDTKSEIDTISDIQKQVKEDLNNFSTRFRLTNLKTQSAINIKQLVYRSTTIFISAFARKHKISANSCFDIIEELAKTNEITQNVAIKLKYAIALACEMRLRFYTNKKSQCDNVEQDNIKKFLDIVGVASTINYFQIAYCLQCEVAKQFNFTKLHFYSDSQLINITIGLAFGIKRFKKLSKDSQNRNLQLNTFDFDSCIEELETANEFISNAAHKASNESCHTELIKAIAENLESEQKFDEALDFYQQLLRIYQSHSDKKALKYHERALEIDQNTSLDPETDRSIAFALHEIACCHIDLHNYHEALTKLNRALEVKTRRALDPDSDRSIAATLHMTGRCHIGLHKYDEAFKNLNRALEINKNTTHDPDTDRCIAVTLHEIGRCHVDLQNYDEALTYLNQALEIEQNITLDPNIKRSISAILHEIGCCHIDLHSYDEALTNLNKALEIKRNTTFAMETGKSIAATLHEIGRCHIELHNYDEALAKLKRSLRFKQNTSLDTETDRSVAVTLHEIGCCYVDLQNYDEALTILKRALEIEQNTTIDVEKDRALAITQLYIGKCLTMMQQYDNSWKCLEYSSKIFQNTTLDESTDQHIAHTFNYKGECLMGVRHYAKAFTYLQKASKTYQTQVNVDKNTKFARTLYKTGLCLIQLNEYKNARNYFKQSLQIYENFPLNKFIKHKIEIITQSKKFIRLSPAIYDV